jgi:metallo-beta-lactamase family protein
VGENVRSPFDYPDLEYVRDVRRSKQLNNRTDSGIIISASGMAESGRILHHLKNNIEDTRNTILLVSFMAEHTLGRKLEEGDARVSIFGETYDVRADVEKIEGYSAHADQKELLAWAGALDRKRLQQVFLVHGEPQAMDTFQRLLQGEGIEKVAAPTRGQAYEF